MGDFERAIEDVRGKARYIDLDLGVKARPEPESREFGLPKREILNNELRRIYELCCEEYRRRLCAAWDMRFDYTWWIGDVVGDELAFDDEFVLSMVEVKHCVENAVTYEAFDEYWRFVTDEAEDGRERPRINFHSWFRGLRPEMLSPEDRCADALTDQKKAAMESCRVRNMVKIAELEIPPLGIYGDKEGEDEGSDTD